ncbi:glycosyl hydrolase 108 family protein [Rhizobium sp. 1399]|uniref:glycoside hydrolase family 108 protein n=1 Tax=Rhizobium sp. 1399 TaxID=2817758 RepID=UPI00285B436B|nr:glycosyl hydrolase 108 family protein [Rhizobium sp. 1399]MDR6664044.1 lysozyme family protein [Rhizobium sp. 1399]
MKLTYPRAMKQIRIFEGGWSNHPKDPGGATMYGIIQREYDAYRTRKDRSKQSVRLITEDEVAEIYRSQYADKVRYDDLPAGVDFATLDGAINSGVSRGSKWLQGALGIAADGVVGAQTVAAAAKADALKTIKAIYSKRTGFLRGLTTFSTFGKGWISRCTTGEAFSMKLQLDQRATSPASQQIVLLSESTTASKNSKAAGAGVAGSAASSATSSTQIDTSNLAGLESILVIGAVIGLAVLTVYLIHRYRVQKARSEAYAAVAATATEASGAAA